MIILSGVSIKILGGDKGAITKAREAGFKQELSNYKEEFELYKVFEEEIIDTWKYDNIKAIIPDLSTKQKIGQENCSIGIVENNLAYRDTGNERKTKWAEEVGYKIVSEDATIKMQIVGCGNVKGIENNSEVNTKIGTEYKLKAIANSKNVNSEPISYEFDGWYKNGDEISKKVELNLEIVEDAEYEAEFIPDKTLIYYTENEEEKIFVTDVTSISSSTYSNVITDKTTITKIEFGKNVDTIESSAFNGCTGITGEIRIPDKVTVLNGSVFYGCTGIEKVDLNNVTVIGGSCFREAINIKEIQGDKVKEIQGCAFYRCEKLENLQLGSVNNSVEIISTYYTFISSNPNLTLKICINCQDEEIKKLIEDSCWLSTAATIEYYDVQTGELVNILLGQKYKGNTDITWEEIPNKDKITEIRDGAFNGCTGITGEIKIPDKVTVLNGSVFYGCTGIEKVDLNNVTVIGGSCFREASNIKEIRGDKVKEIQGCAFYKCKKIENLQLGSVNNSVEIISTYYTFISSNPNLTLKIYINGQDEEIKKLIKESCWLPSTATIEYYDYKTGEKIN